MSQPCPILVPRLSANVPKMSGQMSRVFGTNVLRKMDKCPMAHWKSSNLFPTDFQSDNIFRTSAVHLYATVRNPLSIDSKCQQIRHSTGNNVTPMLLLRYSYVTAMLLCNGFQKAKTGETSLRPLLLQKPIYKILLPLASHNSFSIILRFSICRISFFPVGSRLFISCLMPSLFPSVGLFLCGNSFICLHR